MESRSFHVQYSLVSVLLSLCIASIIAVSMICGHHFDRSVRISGAELYQYGPVSIPLVELRSKVIAASDHHLINSNANRSSHLHRHLHINELMNQTVLVSSIVTFTSIFHPRIRTAIPFEVSIHFS